MVTKSPDKRPDYHLHCIGNAVVDILIKIDSSFLDTISLTRGAMNRIDVHQAEELFSYLKSIIPQDTDAMREVSGGCSPNVAAVANAFGAKVAFTGKVGDDDFGKRFVSKFDDSGIMYNPSIFQEGGKTARSLILVDEKGIRTMCTYLGEARNLVADDVSGHLVQQSQCNFFTSYLLEAEQGQKIVAKVIDIAKQHNRSIAFSLADVSVVQDYRDTIFSLLPSLNYLFGNRSEVRALYGVEDEKEAMQRLAKDCKQYDLCVNMTCSNKGVVIISKDSQEHVKPEKTIDNVVDTTGAGASYAAGFLYAVLHKFSFTQAATLGNQAAGLCIQQLGARPSQKLRGLLAKI